MAEAQRHCRDNYKDLATIRDQEDLENLNALKTTVHSVSSRRRRPGSTVTVSMLRNWTPRAWAGLYDDVDSWRWSLSNASFYKAGETEYRRWQPEEPHNRFKEYCSYIVLRGTWGDVTCDHNFNAVCFDVRGPDSYVYINTLMTWPEAQSYCREHHTDLVSVRNLEDNQMVQNVLPHGDLVWIGLYRDGWKWSDGSDSSFRNWEANEEGGGSIKNCLSVDFSADGRWETLDCNLKSAFICYTDVALVSKRVMKVRLVKSSSSLDLKDPVVMEDLLKKVHLPLISNRTGGA
ncbi:C-type mannose receptor 2 [Liparis tanakae]|uniref:C-type mannose receptor 2 n=1 Tax=Liparis tanakae TaxID=230148 RepID=A0A4Z2EPB4_9TELE|nr:C-type mannose receptor 2 [Liparis tanakae]